MRQPFCRRSVGRDRDHCHRCRATIYFQWVSTVTVIAFVVGFPVEGGPDARYARPRSERIRLDTLVDGYTINGAYQLGRSHELGSIEVGKQADLVILNQNLFDVNRYDVHKTKPVAVIMDGELVHGEL